jgi:hypothetical protein
VRLRHGLCHRRDTAGTQPGGAAERPPSRRECRERRLEQVAQSVRAVEPMLNRRNGTVCLDHERIDNVGERQRRISIGHAAEGPPRVARERATVRHIELHGQSVAESLLQAQASQIWPKPLD